MKRTIWIFLVTAVIEVFAVNKAGRAYTWTDDNYKYDKTLREQLVMARANNFVHYVDKAGLGYLLDGKGYYTIFAPSDYAFQALEQDSYCQPEYNYEHYNSQSDQYAYARKLRPSLLKQFILGRYHLINLQASNEAHIPNIIGIPVPIFSYGEIVVANGGQIIRGDLLASNGIVHIVDKIYCLHKDSALEVLRKNSDDEHVSAFLQALNQVYLTPWLSFGQSVTVLVPTKEEIQKYKNYKGSYNNEYTGVSFEEFLKSRVLFGIYYPENLEYLTRVRSIFGTRLQVNRISANEVSVKGHAVYLSNIKVVKNGVVFLPKPYIPESNIGRAYGQPPQGYGGGPGMMPPPPYYYPPLYPAPPPEKKSEGDQKKKPILGQLLGMLGGGGGLG